jgi:Tol biopolymer transport system component
MPQADIWLLDSSDGMASRLTFGSTNEQTALWSPDGRDIVFTVVAGGGSLYRKPATGAGKEELVLESKVPAYADDWSSDGGSLLYEVLGEETGVDLWILRMAPNQESFPLVATKANEGQGQFSPDGRWMAYASDESGAYEVYVQPFPPTGGKWQVSTRGGAQPQWRRDGKEIFYIAADRNLLAVDVKTTPELLFGTPRPLFLTRVPALTENQIRNTYVPDEDGQRFLVLSYPEEPGGPVTLVLNWTAGLKR